jgi:ribulose-5-phosphate 4-epimerase/fuculose-1-phosphate aldolase
MFAPTKAMDDKHLERLDRAVPLARTMPNGGDDFWQLSTAEQAYIGLAANRTDLLKEHGMTIAQAIDRLGWADTVEMVNRWK